MYFSMSMYARIGCFSGHKLHDRTMGGHVYILASRKYGTLYTGVTSDLNGRIWQHQTGQTGGFVRKHNVLRLVWYQEYNDIRDAIHDEHRIKRWRRKWKLELIEAMNPNWDDLSVNLW